LGEDLPVYCDPQVERRLRAIFDYAFDPATRAYPAGGVPRLALRPVDGSPLQLLGAEIVPIRLQHGRFGSWGYRCGDVAYCTDTNGIPPESMRQLEGLDVLVLDCLRDRPHATHFSRQEAIETAQRIAPRRTIFTHMCHDLDHDALNADLPAGMELAYDGMRIPLSG
jgi:phosphoribosyl 1,2-cyclic phosphate phosphodiesterase